MSLFHRAKEIFIAASEYDAGARIDYVKTACGGDRELNEEVLSLLEQHESLADPHVDAAAEGAAGDGPPSPGTVLAGRYHLLHRLGRGGMGSVYLAHDRTLDIMVAVKFLSPVTPGS
ncbi:hypothetical protein JW905_02480, partial [bacterium]|nr:hypothetical protein [candidate division CSSED10-310 bacterium]